jgi:hypothetical protein
MMHHSEIPYAVAAEKAAEWAKQKYSQQLETGKAHVGELIQHLMDHQPIDNMVWHHDLNFASTDPTCCVLEVRDKSKEMFAPLRFHANAISQASVKAGIPVSYVNTLLEEHQADLAAVNFNRRFSNVETTKRGRPRRYNLRSVNNEVRGFVSDSFPRWDSNALVEAFIGSVMEYGGVVVEATTTDLRFSIKAVLPVMFEPIKNEIMLLGMALRNSDFGVAMYDISALVDRLKCTNLMTMQSEFAKRHLGRQYEDGELYSQGTMNKETEALISATKDIVKGYLSPPSIEMQLEHIRVVGSEEIDADKVFVELRKKQKLTKEEEEKAKQLYRSADTENLPRGDTRWRLANALSYLSREMKSTTDRALELEEIAGEVAGLKVAA